MTTVSAVATAPFPLQTLNLARDTAYTLGEGPLTTFRHDLTGALALAALLIVDSSMNEHTILVTPDVENVADAHAFFVAAAACGVPSEEPLPIRCERTADALLFCVWNYLTQSELYVTADMALASESTCMGESRLSARPVTMIVSDRQSVPRYRFPGAIIITYRSA